MINIRPITRKQKFFATCDIADSVGNVVYISNNITISDNTYTVAKVDISNYNKVPGIGIIVAKSSATKCIVQTEGEAVGIYTGLTAGRVYFIGVDSNPTLVPPAPPISGFIYLQAIGTALDSNVLELDFNAEVHKRVG